MAGHDVCYVTFPNYPKKNSGRGLDRYAYELVRGVSEQIGFDVSLVAPKTNRTNYFVNEFETAVHLRGVKAKIYHATSEHGLGSLLLAKKRPIVVTVHDLLPQLFFRYSPLVFANQRLHLSLVRYADLVITTSSFYSRLLQERFNVSPRRIEVIRYGVDHEIFRSKDERRKGTPSRILYLGGLNLLKGAGDLIDAFARLSGSHDARLVIGGKGKHATELRNIAHRLGVAEKVSFPGFIEEAELPDLYSSMDVLVWPSFFGFGLSTLEAMACGTPVVGAKCLDSEEYLGEAGLLYHPGDVEQLNRALKQVLSSQDSWKDWSAKALEWSENFSWSKMAKQMCSTYEKHTDMIASCAD